MGCARLELEQSVEVERQGGLAGAVGAEHRDPFAGVDGEREIVEDGYGEPGRNWTLADRDCRGAHDSGREPRRRRRARRGRDRRAASQSPAVA